MADYIIAGNDSIVGHVQIYFLSCSLLNKRKQEAKFIILMKCRGDILKVWGGRSYKM